MVRDKLKCFGEIKLDYIALQKIICGNNPSF